MAPTARSGSGAAGAVGNCCDATVADRSSDAGHHMWEDDGERVRAHVVGVDERGEFLDRNDPHLDDLTVGTRVGAVVNHVVDPAVDTHARGVEPVETDAPEVARDPGFLDEFSSSCVVPRLTRIDHPAEADVPPTGTHVLPVGALVHHDSAAARPHDHVGGAVTSTGPTHLAPGDLTDDVVVGVDDVDELVARRFLDYRSSLKITC